jgi:hypothetical protein
LTKKKRRKIYLHNSIYCCCCNCQPVVTLIIIVVLFIVFLFLILHFGRKQNPSLPVKKKVVLCVCDYLCFSFYVSMSGFFFFLFLFGKKWKTIKRKWEYIRFVCFFKTWNLINLCLLQWENVVVYIVYRGQSIERKREREKMFFLYKHRERTGGVSIFLYIVYFGLAFGLALFSWGVSDG